MREMITIIEGTDATGKTTLATELAKRTNANYIHADKPVTLSWHEEYVQPLIDLHATGDIVCDRWHLGELVFPRLYNRVSLFTDFQAYEHCTKIIAALTDVRIIVVQRDTHDIERTLRDRGETSELLHVLAAQTMFQEIARNTRAHTVHLMTVQQATKVLLG